MNSIKLIIIVVISLANVGLSSCGEVPTRDEVFSQDDTAIADNRCEEIINSLYNKDSEALKNIFSSNTVEKNEDFDDDIEYLMDIYKGEVISKDGATVYLGSTNNGEKTGELRCVYKVKTDIDEYLIFWADRLVDTSDPDNVGVYALQIIKQKDKEKEFKSMDGELWFSGIYRPSES